MSSSNHTVRPAGSGKTHAVVCVLCFVATGVAVYLLLFNRAEWAERYSATATVSQQVAGGDADGTPKAQIADIRRTLLSEANLRHVLKRESSPIGDLFGGSVAQVEQVRRNLRIDVTKTSSPDQLRISIGCTDSDAGRAVRLVNALAEQYASRHWADRKAAGERAYRQAQDAARRAREEYASAKGRFDEFLQRHFREHQFQAERGAEEAAAQAPAGALRPWSVRSPSSGRRMIENPEWTKLAEQITELTGRWEELLIKRTPLHPEVQDIQFEIAERERRLANVPQQIPATRSEPAEGGPVPALQPSAEAVGIGPKTDLPGGIIWGENTETYHAAAQEFLAYREAMDRAEEIYQRLADTERRAWQKQVLAPRVQLQLAESDEVAKSSDHASRLLLMALAAALSVAFGVGMIASGFAVDPPLRTPGEAEAVSPVPVVGTIPATHTAEPQTSCGRRWTVGGGTLILGGMALLVLCFGVLLIVFG